VAALSRFDRRINQRFGATNGYCDCFREASGHDRFRRHGIARSVAVSAFGGKMSTDGHLGSGEALRNHFDDRGWCVDSGVVCLADMETTASCSHRMRCSRAGRVPDVPWAGATAFPSGAIARRLLPNSRLCEMNALLARQFIRRQCHATFMVDQVAVSESQRHRYRNAHLGQRLLPSGRHLAAVGNEGHTPIRRSARRTSRRHRRRKRREGVRLRPHTVVSDAVFSTLDEVTGEATESTEIA
jgi:hypothetical protein